MVVCSINIIMIFLMQLPKTVRRLDLFINKHARREACCEQRAKIPSWEGRHGKINSFLFWEDGS